MTRIITLVAFSVLAAALNSMIAYAAETGPVAIVEDVSFDTGELQFMDLLGSGPIKGIPQAGLA